MDSFLFRGHGRSLYDPPAPAGPINGTGAEASCAQLSANTSTVLEWLLTVTLVAGFASNLTLVVVIYKSSSCNQMMVKSMVLVGLLGSLLPTTAGLARLNTTSCEADDLIHVHISCVVMSSSLVFTVVFNLISFAIIAVHRALIAYGLHATSHAVRRFVVCFAIVLSALSAVSDVAMAKDGLQLCKYLRPVGFSSQHILMPSVSALLLVCAVSYATIFYRIQSFCSHSTVFTQCKFNSLELMWKVKITIILVIIGFALVLLPLVASDFLRFFDTPNLAELQWIMQCCSMLGAIVSPQLYCLPVPYWRKAVKNELKSAVKSLASPTTFCAYRNEPSAADRMVFYIAASTNVMKVYDGNTMPEYCVRNSIGQLESFKIFSSGLGDNK